MTVTIIMTTYDPGNNSRTPLAVATLTSLLSNLRYSDLHWIIADDGSNQETHIAPLKKLLADVSHEISVVDRLGVGASKNTALKLAFERSPYVLLLEDDWLLTDALDLAPFVGLLENNSDIGMIRFGYLGGTIIADYEGNAFTSFWRLRRGSGVYIYSGQISLRHKRFYDACGMHEEGISPGEEELEFCKRFNGTEDAPDIVWPASQACQFNSGSFKNIGTGNSLNDIEPGT